jgi:hypothetical protein
VDVRGRLSQDSGSDLLQLQSRYEFLRPRRNSSWLASIAAGQLFFGGNALYAASEALFRYSQPFGQACGRRFDLTLQHQHFHGQRNLNSLEARLAAGLECQVELAGIPSVLDLEFGLLSNTALSSGRPGGHRRGWQVNADWQWPVSRGLVRSQMNYTRLQDQTGYSPLLANGVDRWLERSYLLMQYQRPVQPGMTFLASFYHQYQRSNIALFDTLDSSLEFGLSFAF